MAIVSDIKEINQNSLPIRQSLRCQFCSSATPNSLELVEQLLSKGFSVKFIGTGYSMFPSLKNNDTIIIEPLGVARLRIGEIVFIKISHQNYLIHRIIKIGVSNKVITRGDALLNEDQPVNIKDILGKVVSVKRRNKEKRLNTALARNIGYLIAYLFWLQLLIQARILKNQVKYPTWVKWIFFKIIYGKEKNEKSRQGGQELLFTSPHENTIKNSPYDFNTLNTIYQKSKNFIFLEMDKSIVNQGNDYTLIPIIETTVNLDNLYQLNETGLIIWELIDGQENTAAISEIFSKKCRINLSEAQKDVINLIKELYKLNFVIRKN